jgi:hypothetical protein
MSKIRTTLAIMGALALAPALALAGGDGTGEGAGGAKSKVVIKSLKATGASGKVSSGDNKCEGGRRVQFFRLDDFISVKIQKTRTNGGGNWRTKKDLKPGTYFAKVDSVPGCRYDVSKYEKLR